MPVDLHYRSIGSGAPLIILHGLLGNGRNWSAQGQRLAEHCRVLLPDARNHGRSPHVEAMDYPRMAGDLLHLMDHLGLERASLVGHSMGGKTAMVLALRYPERVERLAIVDIAPVHYDHDFDEILSAMAELDLATLSSRADADTALARHLPEPGLRAYVLTNLVGGPEGWRCRLNLAAIEAAISELTGFPSDVAGLRYEGPVRFLAGALSNYLLPEHRVAITHYFPSAELESIDSAGHWPHVEQSEAFHRALERFLVRSGAY